MFVSGTTWIILMCFDIPSRELTYPTLGKGESSSKCNFWGYVSSLEGTCSWFFMSTCTLFHTRFKKKRSWIFDPPVKRPRSVPKKASQDYGCSARVFRNHCFWSAWIIVLSGIHFKKRQKHAKDQWTVWGSILPNLNMLSISLRCQSPPG